MFVAGFNLEVGMDTCLFEGMDTYWKTLIQIAFPVYGIFLVIMIILISQHSTKFAHLIGRKNPVATLATLVLLSYTKLINTIIASLSFAILDYPDGSRRVVWLPDGTVNYLRGKHILLFFLAVLILLAGTAYTTLLLGWQWFIQYQNKKIFMWMKYHKLFLFLEPYHAPCDFRYRYWTGLLLLVRALLYIASALNVSRASGIDLLITAIVMVILILIKSHLGSNGCIYKKWPIDVIELMCYVNLTILSLTSLYTLEAKQNHIVVAYISGTITFALFLLVLCFHVMTETCCRKINLFNKLKQTRELNINEYPLINQPTENDLNETSQPTQSWVDPPSRKECTSTSSDTLHLHKVDAVDRKTPPLSKEIEVYKSDNIISTEPD